MSTRTIRCKLQCAQNVAAAFLQTQEAFGQACDAILQEALEAKVRNPIELHRLVYAKVREKFKLSANLTVRAIRRVSAGLFRKKWYLNIVVEEEELPLKEGPAVGIDLGLINTVYTSTEFFLEGASRQDFKKQRAKIRASLQSKATRGSHKKLR